jgi:hypothetical protein
MANKSDFVVGQKLYVVPGQRDRQYEDTISKVGNKFLTLERAGRVDIQTMTVEGRWDSGVHLSEEHYLARNKLETTFALVREYMRSGGLPPNLNEKDVDTIISALANMGVHVEPRKI